MITTTKDFNDWWDKEKANWLFRSFAEKAYVAGRHKAADRCGDIIEAFPIGPSPKDIEADKRALINCVEKELYR